MAVTSGESATFTAPVTVARSTWSATRPSGSADLLLRVTAAAALLVSAVVHLRLADDYALAFPGGLGGGTVFRLEAVGRRHHDDVRAG